MLKSKKKYSSPEYPAGPVLLDIARAEYAHEIDRATKIDGKVGVTLPIVATYFFLVLQDGTIQEKMRSPVSGETFLAALGSMLPQLTYIATLVLAALAIYFLFCAIRSRAYKAIDIRYFDTEDLRSSQTRFSAAVIEVFKDAIDINTQMNYKRTRWYERGWRLALISLVLYVIYVFLSC